MISIQDIAARAERAKLTLNAEREIDAALMQHANLGWPTELRCHTDPAQMTLAQALLARYRESWGDQVTLQTKSYREFEGGVEVTDVAILIFDLPGPAQVDVPQGEQVEPVPAPAPEPPTSYGYHFFAEINGGQWHRTETMGEPGGEPVKCSCGISKQDPRVVKVRDHSDDSWAFSPPSARGKCFDALLAKLEAEADEPATPRALDRTPIRRFAFLVGDERHTSAFDSADAAWILKLGGYRPAEEYELLDVVSNARYRPTDIVRALEGRRFAALYMGPCTAA